MIVGRNLRRVREERQWSQDQLAAFMADVGFQWTQSTVSRLESGVRELTVGELLTMSFVLSIDVRDVMMLESSVGVR